MKLHQILILAAVSSARGQVPAPAPALAQLPRIIEAAASLPGPANLLKEGVVKSNENGEVVLNLPDSGPKDRIEYTLRDGKALLEKPTEKGIQLYLEVEKISNKGPQYIQLKDFTARSVGQWMDRSGDAYRYSKVKSKKALFDKAVALRKKIDENLTSPADQQDWAGLADQYRQMGGLIGEAYMDESDSELRAGLSILLSNLIEEGTIFLQNKLHDEKTSESASKYRDNLTDEEKSFYRMNDNYRPEVYPMIAKRSGASVAIVRKGSAVPLGSGALIGPNLVLTCRHNIDANYARDYDHTNYEVWLDREERVYPPDIVPGAPAPPPPPPPRKYKAREISHVTRPGAATLDFCLLELNVPAGVNLAIEPLKINMADIAADTSIFVVGYPQGGYRTVHDSSWVLFPHKILSKKVRGEITVLVKNEFLLDEPNRSTEASHRNAILKADDFMERVYGPAQDDPNAVYRLMKDGEEYIGIESDTFEGDSGAPVMVREDGSLIGLLYKGPGDGGVSARTESRRSARALLPGASQHERVVPIQLIMAQLDIPNLKSKGVVFDD